jgi:hypothetical protein
MLSHLFYEGVKSVAPTLKINYVSKSKGESEKKSIVLKVDLSIQENSVCEK